MYKIYSEIIAEIKQDIKENEEQLQTFRKLFRKYRKDKGLKYKIIEIIEYLNQEIGELRCSTRLCESILAKQRRLSRSNAQEENPNSLQV